jgi:phosphoesterase RecJ-like protein
MDDIEAKTQSPDCCVPEELVRFIRTGSNFIIAGHKEPDGDCVGSQLALCSALKRLGKTAVVCSAGPFKRTELRDYVDQFVDIKDINLENPKVIIVDCNGRERTGDIQDFLEKYPNAVIDHHSSVLHPESTDDAPIYTDANSPSCTLLIYKLIVSLGLQPVKDEAVLLFFGLCTDAGFFRFLNEKNSAVFEDAAELVRCGASPKSVYNTISGGKSYNSRILLGRILSRTESHFDGKFLISSETLDEFNIYGYESRDSDSLNQLLLSIEGVEVIVIIRQECAENCTVSLRSVDQINVAQVAATFGGGGHKNAAGLTMKGNIAEVKQKMLEAFICFFNRK